MGIVSSIISEFMHASEKIIACFACTMLISCIVATLIVVLGLGIGLGYNYCFVDLKTRYKHVKAGYRYPGGPRQSYKSGYRSGYRPNYRAHDKESSLSNVPNEVQPETKPNRRNSTEDTTMVFPLNTADVLNSTNTKVSGDVNNIIQVKLTEAVETERAPMIIPINGLNIIELLAKLRSENRNYSLQIVT